MAPNAAPDVPEIRQAAEAAPADADLSDGFGLIEVDFRGFPGNHEAWIAGMSMRGSRSEESMEAEDGRATVEVPPGLHEVWWVDPETGQRLGSRVRAVAGRVVRLRATDASLPGPGVPAGLAVLSVRVLASWGGGLTGVMAYVEGKSLTGPKYIRLRTGAGGVFSVTLRPGGYDVSVGDYSTRVRLEPGRETRLEIRHEAQGDLLFDPPRVAPLRVQRRRDRALFAPLWIHGEPARAGFLYLGAGTYDVICMHGPGGSGTILGTTEVRPGQATLFRYSLPRGAIVLRLPAATPTPFARLWRGKELVAQLRWQNLLSQQGAYVLASASHLPAGPYRLRVDQGDSVLLDRTVDIADEPLELDLR